MHPASEAALLLNEGVGVAYAALAVLILFQAKRSRTGILLAACCVLTAVWAAASALTVGRFAFTGLTGGLDVVRAAVWYGFTLHLYRRAMPPRDAGARSFAAVAAAIVIATVGFLAFSPPLHQTSVSLASAGLALRLFVALGQLLLLENLFRNSTDGLRWTLQVTCIALGGPAAYDLVVCADAALFHRFSLSLVQSRPLVAGIVIPLLAVAAARNQRWAVGIHVSRTAVFHSATLLASGVFLLALAAAGELVRQFGFLAATGLSPWGSVAQICLVFAGLMTIAVVLTSTNSRSRLRAVLVDHFFTHRFDYRREWLRCIETLSGQEHTRHTLPVPLETRAVQALAQLVDSPAGVLLLRDRPDAPLQWAGAWNAPPSTVQLPPADPLVRALEHARVAIDLERSGGLTGAWAAELMRGHAGPWLAVPLRPAAGAQTEPEQAAAAALDGCVLLAASRAPFALDTEVFDLLRTVAAEVATYLAERRAARVLSETEQLRDYGKRFAFVAHDIKNVSSQLSMLLDNAQTHLANPEFQRDMLVTVHASVGKIQALIRRLQTPEMVREGGTLVPAERLEGLAAAARRHHGATIVVQPGARAGEQNEAVAMAPTAFDMVVTHLLDNAIQASLGETGGVPTHPPATAPVTLSIGREGDRITIDIADRGCGMSPEFVRDELFRPFRTSKSHGSGIGAFQARELARAAGGNLLVFSEPGRGTTMRLLLPLAGDVLSMAAA